MNPRSYLLILLLPITLLGCASSGSGRSSAKPVFYPNATLNRVGEAKARDEAQACMARAQDAGLTPEESTNAVVPARGPPSADRRVRWLAHSKTNPIPPTDVLCSAA